MERITETMSHEARELYCYITTNPDPMAKLETVYRSWERTGKHAPRANETGDLMIVIIDACREYSKAFSTGTVADARNLFPQGDRSAVYRRLMRDYRAEQDAGNSWL